jgi:hypothetical protein
MDSQFGQRENLRHNPQHTIKQAAVVEILKLLNAPDDEDQVLIHQKRERLMLQMCPLLAHLHNLAHCSTTNFLGKTRPSPPPSQRQTTIFTKEIHISLRLRLRLPFPHDTLEVLTWEIYLPLPLLQEFSHSLSSIFHLASMCSLINSQPLFFFLSSSHAFGASVLTGSRIFVEPYELVYLLSRDGGKAVNRMAV